MEGVYKKMTKTECADQALLKW